MKLNEDQANAITAITNFLLSDNQEFSLVGSAGTGKSFVIKYLESQGFKQVKEYAKLLNTGKEFNDRITITATTHKAANLYANADTIHSYIYSGKTVGASILTNLVIVDEASMLNVILYDNIQKYLETNPNTKIIYVSDSYQLPPINENLSPVYSSDIPSYELTSQVRTDKSNAISALAQYLKKCIDTKSKPILFTDDISVMHTDSVELFKHYYIDNKSEDTVSLAYSWEYVSDINKNILQLLGRNTPNIIPGDTLRISKTFSKHLVTDSKIQVVDIINEGSLSLSVDDEVRITLPCKKLTFLDKYGTKYSVINWTDKPKQLYDIIKQTTTDIRVDKFEVTNLTNKVKRAVLHAQLEYAITIHASQGSTYDNVFIDLDSFNKCYDLDMALRLLYVAVTRAKNKVIFFGELPYRFRG